MLFYILLFVFTASQLPRLPQDICDQLIKERSRFPTLIENNEQLGTILNNTAWAFRDGTWGLSGKNSGNRCLSKAGNIACDILHHKSDNLMWDVIVAADVGSVSSINCGESIGTQGDLNNRPWVSPVNPGEIPPPPPNLLEIRVKILEAQVADLKEELHVTARQIINATRADITELRKRVEQLESRPTPEFDEVRVKAILDEALKNLKVNVGRSFGHTHNAVIVR